MLANRRESAARARRRTRAILGLLACAALGGPLACVAHAQVGSADRGRRAGGGNGEAILEHEPAVEYLPRPSQAELKIVDQLDKPTQSDFENQSLRALAAYVRDFHGVAVHLDRKALEDAGMADDAPVNGKMSQLSLRTTLRLLLKPLELTTIIQNDVLLITTTDVASNILVTRTYPVGDLVERGDYDSLIEAITSTVVPSSWDEVGGPGSLSPVRSARSLVISQTPEIHERVLVLLRSLRAARKLGMPGRISQVIDIERPR